MQMRKSCVRSDAGESPEVPGAEERGRRRHGWGPNRLTLTKANFVSLFYPPSPSFVHRRSQLRLLLCPFVFPLKPTFFFEDNHSHSIAAWSETFLPFHTLLLSVSLIHSFLQPWSSRHEFWPSDGPSLPLSSSLHLLMQESVWSRSCP